MSAALAIALSLLAAEPLKLAAPGFSGVDVPQAQATFFSDHFAQQLNLRGLQVVTASQIGALLGFERQRQLLGCKEDASGSCMAELAAALGVDGVVTGSVGKFDQTFQVNVSVVSSRDGRTLSAFSRKVNGSSAVLDALNDAAEQMARDLPRALGRSLALEPSKEIVSHPPSHQPITPEPTPEIGPIPGTAPKPIALREWFWLPGGFGVLFGAGSVRFFIQANAAAEQLRLAVEQPATHPLTLDQANAIRADGVLGQTLGWSMGAVAGIGLAVAGYCLMAGGPSQPVAFRLVPGPTGLVVSGDFR